jgi:hypothetical protein
VADSSDLQGIVNKAIGRGGMPESRDIAADATTQLGREVTIADVNTILER